MGRSHTWEEAKRPRSAGHTQQPPNQRSPINCTDFDKRATSADLSKCSPLPLSPPREYYTRLIFESLWLSTIFTKSTHNDKLQSLAKGCGIVQLQTNIILCIYIHLKHSKDPTRLGVTSMCGELRLHYTTHLCWEIRYSLWGCQTAHKVHSGMQNLCKTQFLNPNHQNHEKTTRFLLLWQQHILKCMSLVNYFSGFYKWINSTHFLAIPLSWIITTVNCACSPPQSTLDFVQAAGELVALQPLNIQSRINMQRICKSW